MSYQSMLITYNLFNKFVSDISALLLHTCVQLRQPYKLVETTQSFFTVQWLLYLQDNGCYCMLFDTSRCDHGCKMAWEASSVVFLCMQLSLFLQVICNRETTLLLKQPSCFCSVQPLKKHSGCFHHRVVTLRGSCPDIILTMMVITNICNGITCLH